MGPIRGREAIVLHLETVIQAQIHLAAEFEEKGEEFLTQLLGFHTLEDGTQLLTLDEFVPRHGQARAAREERVRCSYRLNREPHFFWARIHSVTRAPEPTVRVELPVEVVPDQKRRHFRVEPFAHSPVEIIHLEVPGAGDDPQELARRCVLFDISLGGMAFNTDIPRSYLEPGTILPFIGIRLPNGEAFRARLVVRSVRRNPSGAYRHRVGAEFFLLEERARDLLNRYIVAKQRADIKKIKRELE